MPTTCVYLIRYDGQVYIVEATSMGRAVEIWTAHVARLWGQEFDGTEQPASCELIHDEPVIRGE